MELGRLFLQVQSKRPQIECFAYPIQRRRFIGDHRQFRHVDYRVGYPWRVTSLQAEWTQERDYRLAVLPFLRERVHLSRVHSFDFKGWSLQGNPFPLQK